MDHSPPGSCVHGILQARYWSVLPCPPPGDLSDPGIEPVSLVSPALVGGFLPPVPPGKPREQFYTATVSTCQLETVQMPAVLGSAAFLWTIQRLSCPAKPNLGVKILFLDVRVISTFNLLGKDDLILHLLGCEITKLLLPVALWGHQRPTGGRSRKDGWKHSPRQHVGMTWRQALGTQSRTSFSWWVKTAGVDLGWVADGGKHGEVGRHWDSVLVEKVGSEKCPKVRGRC